MKKSSMFSITQVFIFSFLIFIFHSAKKYNLSKHNSVLCCFSSVRFSHAVVSDSLQTHGLQHTRPPCPSPTPRVYLLLPKATHSLWDKYKSTVGHTSPTIYYTIIARLLHLSLYKLELSDYSISSMPIMMNHMLLPLTLPCLSLTNHDLPDPYLRHSSEHPQTLSELCSDSTRGPCWPHSTLCCLPL